MRIDKAPEQTYLFYDLETSGLSPVFDQVLQFAAVRVNENWEEISRHNIRVQLKKDAIPSPEALLVNGVSVKAFTEGKCEYEAIKEIYELMNKPGTINIGYNSFDFDEEFLRFSFFRNLLPAYTHQFANGCSRADLYSIVLLAYQIKPNLLKWPQVLDTKTDTSEPQYKTSFKLEHLARENNCSQGKSHDALVDVLDTISLAKLLRQDREFWAQASAFFNKKKDRAIFEDIDTEHTILGISYKLALLLDKRPHTGAIPALYIGEHKEYKNQSHWLRLDTVDFNVEPPETLLAKTRTLHKKTGEPPFLFTFSDARVNAGLTPALLSRAQANLMFLTDNPLVFQVIQTHHITDTYKNHDHYDAYAALYKILFASPLEESVLRKFHLAADDRKADVITQLGDFRINKIYQELGIRLMGQLMPSRLSANHRRDYDLYLARVFDTGSAEPLTDHRGVPKLSLIEAISKTQMLLEHAETGEKVTFLTDLRAWYDSHINKYHVNVDTHRTMAVQTDDLLEPLSAVVDHVEPKKRVRDDSAPETLNNAPARAQPSTPSN